MKKLFSLLLFFAAAAFGLQNVYAQKASELKYYDVKQLIAEGNAVMIGQAEKPQNDSCYYYRFGKAGPF